MSSECHFFPQPEIPAGRRFVDLITQGITGASVRHEGCADSRWCIAPLCHPGISLVLWRW
jgi:hypothetical protein